MKENVQIEKTVTPMLFPFDPNLFWQQVRLIIREEIANLKSSGSTQPLYETPGLTYKPLFKLVEVCKLFQVTKPTIYKWIERGRLKPYKIESRLFFLWNDILQLLQPKQDNKDQMFSFAAHLRRSNRQPCYLFGEIEPAALPPVQGDRVGAAPRRPLTRED